jgi:hypothetical protein
MVGREAIEVSDPCLKPLTPSRDEFQILVRELVPLALDPTFRLRPHALDHGPIHVALRQAFAQRMKARQRFGFRSSKKSGGVLLIRHGKAAWD